MINMPIQIEQIKIDNLFPQKKKLTTYNNNNLFFFLKKKTYNNTSLITIDVTCKKKKPINAT